MTNMKQAFIPNLELRAAREMAGLTQEELARAIGVTQSQIAKLERGERNVAAETAGKLGIVLKVNPTTLLPREVRSAFSGAVPAVHPAAVQSRISKPQAAGVVSIPVHSFHFSVPRPDGRKVLEEVPTGITPIPSYLAGVTNAYAVMVADESMVPRYRPGQILHINPLRPPTQGAAVMVETTDGMALLCEWGGWDGGDAIVSTYAGGQIVVPSVEIESVHVVVGSEEAF